ncbi:MAG: GDP-mannose 4,6-dehydratase [Candidatus Atabeyarchaeum deiterrae]
MKTNKVSGKVVVVTGGAGFIGSHLCDKLIAFEPSKLLIIDDFSLGKMRNIEQLAKNPIVEIHRLDASNYSEMANLFEKNHVEVVFNLAVIPLPKSLEAPKETIDKNISITSTVCELLRNKLCASLVHCSSSEAYGSALYVPMDEKHPTFPLTPYAASKIACDHIAMSYYRTYNLDIAIARPFNAYGPRQNEGSYAAVIPITICRILSGQPPIIHGDGLQTRDYTYVEDTAEAIASIYEISSTRGKTINIASGKEIRIKDIINLIVKLTNYDGEIIHGEERPGDVRRHKGDISLAKKLIGYSPKTDFETGLQKTIRWYESQSSDKRDPK